MEQFPKFYYFYLTTNLVLYQVYLPLKFINDAFYVFYSFIQSFTVGPSIVSFYLVINKVLQHLIDVKLF